MFLILQLSLTVILIDMLICLSPTMHDNTKAKIVSMSTFVCCLSQEKKTDTIHQTSTSKNQGSTTHCTSVCVI